MTWLSGILANEVHGIQADEVNYHLQFAVHEAIYI